MSRASTSSSSSRRLSMATAVVAVLLLTVSPVSSQGTCGVLPGMDLVGRGNQGTLLDADNCCLACQQTQGCTVAVHDTTLQQCYLIGIPNNVVTSDLLVQDPRFDVFFPLGAVNVVQVDVDAGVGVDAGGAGADAAEGEDLVTTIWNLSTATLAGIAAAIVGGLIFIGCIFYAVVRSRRAKREYQNSNPQYQV